MSADTPTGGQLCVRGIMQQMLRGLAQGTALAFDRGKFDGTALRSVTLTLEPANGGDQQAETPDRRIVEQVKIRTNGKAWTDGEIAGEVLPDLLRAVDAEALPTTYRFASDGLLNCAALVTLSQRLHGRAVPAKLLAALDDEDRKAFYYAGWKSERAFFAALAKRARCEDLAAFWQVLANLEIEGGLTEAKLIEQIDAFLFDIVDFAEQVQAKRAQLIVLMLDLAGKGGTTTVEALLEQADLPVERALHYAKVPVVTGEALAHDLALLGYDADHDVRRPPRPAGKDLTFFAGDSGYGKSWRVAAMLRDLDRQGHLAILVTNAASLETIQQKIADLVWHSSFDAGQTMPGLQRRLGHRFVDADGVWLTVGVDDLQDRDLLNAIRAANWAQYGVRVIATVPMQMGDEMAELPVPPAVVPVERFSLPQVRRFLEDYGRQFRALPGDVRELLQTPIFADLYRRIGGDGWMPLDEYALVDRFWHHATFATKGMADYQDDPLGLEQLGRSLLTPAGHYPWSMQAAMAAGLTQEARARLVKTGIIRQGQGGVVVIHDRILNWVIARAIAADLQSGAISVAQALETLDRLHKPDEIAPGLAHRLGYVLLDFLWLIARSVDADRVAQLLTAYLDHPENRTGQSEFIEDHLAGLGAPIVSALAILARRGGDETRINAIHAAKAIAAIGQAEPQMADATVIGLLADGGTEEAIRSGLIAAAGLPLPAAVERLWGLHLARREALAAAADTEDNGHERFELHNRAETSFNALKSTVIAAPGWIGAKLGQTAGALPAILLLELLLEVEHGAGRDIWFAHKAAFLARIPAGKSVLPRAIKRFGDGDETARLEADSADADWREPQRRFDALIRLAPQRAAAGIGELPQDLLGWRSGFSVTRLLRNGGEDVRPALLARHPAGWEGMVELARTYWYDRLAIDQASFVAMIAALEGRLAERAGQPWQPRAERSLVQFLAETTRPDLLAILESYRGSNFERLLRDVAMSGEGRNSLCVDTDAEHIERLLLMIGGSAFGDMVAGALARDRVIARRDGYEAAVLLPSGTVGAGLSAAAASEDRREQESYALTVALAVHQCDDALYDLVMDTQSAYNDAINVRDKRGPWSAAVDARMRADLASPDSATRIGATCALAMAPPDDASALLVATLARCPDDDPSALTVVRISGYLGLYSAAMLPQLERMLASSVPNIRETVLPFLAEHGDQAARAVAHGALASGPNGQFDHSVLRAGYALSQYEPTGGPASDRLIPFLERHHGMYPIGLIARRLHDNAVVTDEALIELGYSSERVPSDCIFLLVDRIRTFDAAEALAIAEHRFTRSPSAGGARQIIELGGGDGVDHLIEAYLAEKRHEVRWIIARALRRHGERQQVMDRLADLAGRNSADARVAAAELLGWVPGDRTALLLASLADDPVTDVSDAALAAESRLEAERWGRVLIAEIPDADHFGRWSRVHALVDLIDPYLLERDVDGLQIGDVVEPLDEIFAIWIEKELVQRKTALIKKAEQLDRQI